MKVDTNTMISITEVEQDFSKAARVVTEHGSAVILKENVPSYLILDFKKLEQKKIESIEDIFSIAERKEPQPNCVDFAAYTGVRYDNTGLSNQRVRALDKAKNMVTIRWMAPADFPTWCRKNGNYNEVRATDGTKSTKFLKGKTYTGIPYSMKNYSWDDEIWKEKLRSLTAFEMTGIYYLVHRKSTTANGINCSYFVYSAFKYAVPSYDFVYQPTRTMLNSLYYKKIKLSQMKPGDIFLKNGHVMLYAGKNGSGYAVFESDARDSKCSYNVYSYNKISQYQYYRFKGFDD